MQTKRRSLFRILLSILIMVFSSLCSVHSKASSADFSYVTFPGYDSEIADGYVYCPEKPELFPVHEIRLKGLLYRPEGSGPFPAAVLLHGCSGITSHLYWWAQTLQDWGYVALIVDSFGPRSILEVCSKPLYYKAHPHYKRMPDVYAAKAYLKSLPFVHADRIAVIGWSHGASTALFSVDDRSLDGRVESSPFGAAIAFYPRCEHRIYESNAPLLVLIGEEDDWTPASFCKSMQVDGPKASDYRLVVYPGARHGFDSPTFLHNFGSHLVGRHQESAEKSISEVKQFLSRHLSGQKRQGRQPSN